MTLTLSCACYTNTSIDLGLHNQTCNGELNLSTVVRLIRDNFMFVYHCDFFNVYNLVPCRPTYHFTPIFIMYCMAAFVNHND